MSKIYIAKEISKFNLRTKELLTSTGATAGEAWLSIFSLGLHQKLENHTEFKALVYSIKKIRATTEKKEKRRRRFGSLK